MKKFISLACMLMLGQVTMFTQAEQTVIPPDESATEWEPIELTMDMFN